MQRERRILRRLDAVAGTEKPPRALRRLARLGRDAPDLFGFGGAHHEAYQRTVVELWRRAQPGRLHRNLPTVAATFWSRWRSPRFSDVVGWGRAEDADVLAMFDSDGAARADPLLQLTALRLLADDERVALVVASDTDVVLRRRLLLQLGTAASLGTDEVIRELVEGAGMLGYRVRNL